MRESARSASRAKTPEIPWLFAALERIAKKSHVARNEFVGAVERGATGGVQDAGLFKDEAMRNRATGILSSVHIIAVVDGLLRTTAGAKLDAEERRRLDAACEATGHLRTEASKHHQSQDPEAKVRTWDLVVDRDWGVLYGMLTQLAKLKDVIPLGTEAAEIVRVHFATKLDFTRLDTTAQAQIGKGKLAALEALEISPALAATVRPVLKLLRKNHTAYEAAVTERSDTVRVTGELQPLRVKAVEALDNFLSYVEVMAVTPKAKARAATMLAPVDTILSLAKRVRPARPPKDTVDPVAPEAPKAPKAPADNDHA